MKSQTIKTLVAGALAGVALAGCTKGPDMTDVKASRTKPIFHFDLFQAVASNGKTIVATGAGGALVTSSDQGGNWKRQHLPGPASIIGMTHCPDGTYAAVDFYKKAWLGDAAGTQWKSVALDKGVNPLAVTCDPSGNIWIVGSNLSIQSSSDKGATWKLAQLGGDAQLTTVQFVDAQFGVAMGEFGTVATTSDGGKSWKKSNLPQKDYYPYAVVFTDKNNGWVSGLAGVNMHTTDGGKTWKSQTNAAGVPLYALARMGNQIYGAGAGGVVAVLKGDQWERVEYEKPAPAFLTSITSVEDKSLVIAGAAGVVQPLKTSKQ